MNVKIIGYDLKCLQVDLYQNEEFFCEKGAIIYYEGGINKELIAFDKGIGGILKRKISGESIFILKLSNKITKSQRLLVAGKSGLLPINMADFNGQILCRSGYYVASNKNIDIDFSFNLSSLISGIGLIMQKIKGDGTVFLDSFGSAVKIEVAANESIFVDEKSLICIDYNSSNRMQSSFSGTGFLGGEGLTMLQITGPSIVYVNSVNF